MYREKLGMRGERSLLRKECIYLITHISSLCHTSISHAAEMPSKLPADLMRMWLI